MSFQLTQKNWRFYADDAAEPVASLAAENTTAPWVRNSTSVLRLRINYKNLSGFYDNGISGFDFALLVSTDQSTWYSVGGSYYIFSASSDWTWGNGLASSGATVSGAKLTGTSTLGYYHESLGTEYSTTALREVDFAVKLLSTPTAGTIFYFRIIALTASSALDTGATYASVRMVNPPVAISGSGGAIVGGAATIGKSCTVSGSGGAIAGGMAGIAAVGQASTTIIGSGGAVAGGAGGIAAQTGRIGISFGGADLIFRGAPVYPKYSYQFVQPTERSAAGVPYYYDRLTAHIPFNVSWPNMSDAELDALRQFMFATLPVYEVFSVNDFGSGTSFFARFSSNRLQCRHQAKGCNEVVASLYKMSFAPVVTYTAGASRTVFVCGDTTINMDINPLHPRSWAEEQAFQADMDSLARRYAYDCGALVSRTETLTFPAVSSGNLAGMCSFVENALFGGRNLMTWHDRGTIKAARFLGFSFQQVSPQWHRIDLTLEVLQ